MGIEKIKEIGELELILGNLKTLGKKIVHCHGCFDNLHIGHLKHFESAKKQGDILLVTITPDRFIQKGPGRPLFNENLRAEFIAAIETIDFVAINDSQTPHETIKKLKPDIYAKGDEVLKKKGVDPEYDANILLDEIAVSSVGGKIYFTSEETFSSSHIINEVGSALPEESKIYLSSFRKKFDAKHVFEVLDSLKDVRVLIIGDAIIDEYIQCEQIGRSGKEPLISYKLLSPELHAGGVFAVANHLSQFTKEVYLITCIGEEESDFVKKSLNTNIKKVIFTQKHSNTLKKTKYIDWLRGHKIFSIYNTDEFLLNEENEKAILEFLEENLNLFDIIMVSDFGHGIMTPRIIDYLSKKNKFLSINCQLNSGNAGYNFITKYPRADFICINETELRLPFQDKNGKLESLIKKLQTHLKADKISITLGKKGLKHFQEGDIFYSPAFTKHPVDTIGSGDAVFSLNSLLSFKNTDPNLVPFLGNCIGGLATKIVGNSRVVEMGELRRFISYILR